MNQSSVCCMFGMAMTRPSLTMQLTSGVGVFVHVWTLQAIIVTIFSNMTRDISVFIVHQQTDAMRDTDIPILSVCPSVTYWYEMKTV